MTTRSIANGLAAVPLVRHSSGRLTVSAQRPAHRRDATELDVPYYMVLGAHEAPGRAMPANEWFGMLTAPSKERVIFQHSGHRPQFEEPGEFAALMRRVLDEAYPVRSSASPAHIGALARIGA